MYCAQCVSICSLFLSVIISTCLRVYVHKYMYAYVFDAAKKFHVCTCNGGASSIHYACTMYMCLCIMHATICVAFLWAWVLVCVGMVCEIRRERE